MSIFKKISVGIIFAASVLLHVACNDRNNGVASGIDDDDIPFIDGDVFKVVEIADPQPLIAPSFPSDPNVRIAATGANDFAFRLGAALVNENRDENFVVSPYSVWLPLAALSNATSPQHIDALLTALGAVGIAREDVNKAASRMLYDLTLGGWKAEHNPLQIANAVFVDNNVTLRDEFARDYFNYYRGGSINVDFDSQEAVDAVNNWAAENTEGLITNLIERFPPLTVAAIANAIYFSDRWEAEFDPTKTEEGDFHAPRGITRAQFMQQDFHTQPYFEDDDLQAIHLQFASGGGMSVILPKTGGAEDLLASMTSDRFNTIMQSSVLAQGTLRLPRFSMENFIDLKESLKVLGVPLFEERTLGFLIEETDRVSLSAALQKALIKVDEEGTTAAAVTVLIAVTTSVPTPVMSFEMTCDRPFMFVLYDQTREGGRQILFTGVVNQP